MRNIYIAIEREYGSGGTQIARRLAEACGVRCYGREILEAVSEQYGVSIDAIQRSEESVTNSFLYTVNAIAQMQSGSPSLLSQEGKLFVAEQAFIRKTALLGPAVYLGHCAAEALSGYPVRQVFIRCSDPEVKRARITGEYGISDAERTRKRFDNKRARYYYANTAKKWDDLRNYDIVLDSARLGIDGCVAALEGLMQ